MTNNLVENTIEQNADSTPADHVNSANGMMMQLQYAAPSHVSLSENNQSDHTQHVALFTQMHRDAVSFHGRVKDPLVFRDSLLALFDVVSSDYRYVPKDRAAYTVFRQMRRASRNKNLFSAQRDYFTWLFNNDPLAFCILDPIIQVHQEGVSFEVFSRDEGCYAQLTLQRDLFEMDSDTVLGTTSIDYSSALFDGIEQIRDHQTTTLDIGQEAVRLQRSESSETDDGEPEDKNEVIEKRINVPKSWIRALLQVQSAGQLAKERIDLDPIALYNVLFELRMHADIKGKRRGLLIELIPQQLPVIILEPFDIAVTSQVSRQQTPYQGQKSKLIRLWGRRRLSLLKRLLPHTDTVSVSLLGQGMPSYWTLTGKGFHFTFAMTGFSQANWSQSLNFDLLLPKRPQYNVLDSDYKENNNVLPLMQALAEQPSGIDALSERLSTQDNPITTSYVRQQLLSGAQQGLIRYDIANQSYYYRPLTQTPLEMAQFAHHNEAEKQAFDLVSREDSVQNLSVQTVVTQGVSISADIQVKEDRRTYRSQLQLGEDGLVSRAECSCPQYLQHRLSQGVCAHLIALRLSYHQYDHTQTNSWHDTRTLSKRVPKHHQKSQKAAPYPAQNVFKTKQQSANNAARSTLSANDILDLSALAQGLTPIDTDARQTTRKHTGHTISYVHLTCDHKKVLIEHIMDNDSTRQQFVFNQPAQAHAAFLQHIARFEAQGFIENKGV
ncbi:hypothetical protein [Psychrobacter aquaticus]|uniref:SWIM-type domain-containing protein n=1 Tax=Psychrobacter aquaticus CMS 56 TaxID=1354303 RepID=U4T7C3_9GAMM|nr:hypothetical protein [Psychrobacter aquaticus]ERL54614.1 hypothetical protein M917_2762 [Psychrobacter aquaticus CMS 56]